MAPNIGHTTWGASAEPSRGLRVKEPRYKRFRQATGIHSAHLPTEAKTAFYLLLTSILLTQTNTGQMWRQDGGVRQTNEGVANQLSYTQS